MKQPKGKKTRKPIAERLGTEVVIVLFCVVHLSFFVLSVLFT
ncbi:unnamed protein product [marine sediment metagenome]|uniref:Uncharacterized protein n=1 Tax=marine sediment metagenome TaxID=412755 RepID=X0YT09_9ZZZZ